MLKRDLKPGDHIYSWRRKALGIYAHHGIYVGDNNVIHFTGDSSRVNSVINLMGSSSGSKGGCGCDQGHGGVILSCLDCFLKGDCLRLYNYGVSKMSHISLQICGRGTCTVAQSNAPDTVIYYAKHLLQNGFGKYHLIRNNCEDFALYCKTGLVSRGNACGASAQVSALRAGVISYRRRYKNDIGVRADKEQVPLERISKWLKARESEDII